MYNFDPFNVLLAIATNIPVLLMTVSHITSKIQFSVFVFVRKMLRPGFILIQLSKKSLTTLRLKPCLLQRWLDVAVCLLTDADCVFIIYNVWSEHPTYIRSHLIAVRTSKPVQIPADGRPEEHAVWFRWTGTRQRLHVRATEENVLYVWWEIDVIECVYMRL